MTDDGTIDYSRFTRAQLIDALSRIDRARYPRNFDALRHELASRVPDTATPSGPLSLPALVWRYAAAVFLLQILAGASLFFVEVVLSGNFNPSSPEYVGNRLLPESPVHLLIRFVMSLIILLAVYVHLGKHHGASFRKAGIAVVVLVSIGGAVIGYFDPYESTYRPYRPIFLFVTHMAANLALFLVAARVCKVPIWVRRTE